MADQDLLYEKKDGIAIITLNRPHRMNALPIDIWADGLAELWKDFDSDPKMRVAVLTATGDRAFCTGVDVKDTAQRNREGRQTGLLLLSRESGQTLWDPLLTQLPCSPSLFDRQRMHHKVSVSG